ncbi:hypothetical protein Dda_1770 [Drechslerella dactyloides]|uniref:Hydrophobin n=1 Tax=Drechslerella dactyloides TaxID=74499 RepID=A0AAD6J431_DREDA|nr:hypothetical protein Dda_1770 [Drechslerella dactyloides]
MTPLLTIVAFALSALSAVSAAPSHNDRGRGRPGRDGDVTVVPGRIGGTGSAGSNAGSDNNNIGNNNGGNTAIGVNDADINQASSSCGNGQIVCCNGPSTNTASSNTGTQRTKSFTQFPQYQYVLQKLHGARINIPTLNRNRESNQSNQCESVTTWKSGSASPICQQTVSCCSDIQGDAVANVGCTAMTIVVNTGNSPVNGFSRKEKQGDVTVNVSVSYVTIVNFYNSTNAP